MTKPLIVPLQPAHLASIQYREDHAEYVSALGEQNKYIEAAQCMGASQALVLGDIVLACAGVNVFWEGVGSLWMRTSKQAEEHWLTTAKASKAFLALMQATFKFRRLQCTVKRESDLNLRFAMWMGFRPESVLRKYGPEGSDYVLLARISK
jgi:hypothetical protein